MKKIITLLLSLGTLTSVFAQNTRDMEDAKRVILGAPRKTNPTQNPKDVVLGGDNRGVYGENGNGYPETYPNGSSSRNVEINNINREYDAKIYSIHNNRYLSAAEKERMIRQLEGDRARAIRNVNNRYGNNKGYKNYGDRDDDDNYKKNKKNKGNNSNHYGWEKGKGNPHKGKY